MATLTIRKYGISLDPDELVDFSEKMEYFVEHFKELDFQQSGTYTFRYSDDECMMKADLQQTADGYNLWVYVQALDEHEYRVQEVAEVFGGYVIGKHDRR